MRKLGELEARIMDLLWTANRPVSVREVREILATRRPLAYTTVMTVMDTLHGKGWLLRDREGRAYIYRPASSREDYVAELMHDALSASADHAAALVRFTEQLNEEESTALRNALRRMARRKT